MTGKQLSTEEILGRSVNLFQELQLKGLGQHDLKVVCDALESVFSEAESGAIAPSSAVGVLRALPMLLEHSERDVDKKGKPSTKNSAPTPATEQAEQYARVCRIGSLVSKCLDPKKEGYAVFVFTLGPGGYASYSSNCKREDVVGGLQEWIDVHSKGTARSPMGDSKQPHA